MPGLNTAYQSLRAGTEAVKEINSIEKDISPVGQSTEDGVAIGVLLGLVGGVERVIREQSRQLDKTPAVFITGGDAEILLPYLTIPAIIQADLVLEGLRIFSDEK
jgi:pantothenate kinase type III